MRGKAILAGFGITIPLLLMWFWVVKEGPLGTISCIIIASVLGYHTPDIGATVLALWEGKEEE